jgi:hypothetical protein
MRAGGTEGLSRLIRVIETSESTADNGKDGMCKCEICDRIWLTTFMAHDNRTNV